MKRKQVTFAFSSQTINEFPYEDVTLIATLSAVYFFFKHIILTKIYDILATNNSSIPKTMANKNDNEPPNQF